MNDPTPEPWGPLQEMLRDFAMSNDGRSLDVNQEVWTRAWALDYARQQCTEEELLRALEAGEERLREGLPLQAWLARHANYWHEQEPEARAWLEDILSAARSMYEARVAASEDPDRHPKRVYWSEFETWMAFLSSDRPLPDSGLDLIAWDMTWAEAWAADLSLKELRETVTEGERMLLEEPNILYQLAVRERFSGVQSEDEAREWVQRMLSQMQTVYDARVAKGGDGGSQ